MKNILKYLFCFFVLSTKLTYSSSKFVLIFIYSSQRQKLDKQTASELDSFSK